jgi:hypothetical protein
MGTLMGKNIYPMGKWVWVRLGTTHTRLPVGKINPKAHIHMHILLLAIQSIYGPSNHVYIYSESPTQTLTFLFLFSSSPGAHAATHAQAQPHPTSSATTKSKLLVVHPWRTLALHARTAGDAPSNLNLAIFFSSSSTSGSSHFTFC